MIHVGNKMHKAFPLLVMEFPLPGEVPTASEESSHCQKKREVIAVKIALLLKSRRNCQSKSDDSYTKLVPHVTPCILRITVIEFGDSYEVPVNNETTNTASDENGKKKGRAVTVTTDDMQKRKNDVKTRTTLLLSLPDEHQLRFSKHKTVQELWDAILKTFGVNEATKKTKKNFLKQQYGNFKAEGSETLEQMFNRLQSQIPRTLAFISSAKHSKGNEEVNTASVSTTSTNVPTASANIGVASISQDTACAYISGSQIKFKDINQIDEDDIEEMDIKWNMALLSMRANRQVSKVEEQAPKALMAIDGVGWDWSYMANDEENHALIADEETPLEFTLMAKTSDDSKIFDNSLCSKDCKKNTDSLNSKITDLTDKLFDAKNMLYHYKLGLAQVESRLAEHRDREIKYCEKIRGLELEVKFKTNSHECLAKKLETLNKEKEELDGKLAGFKTASKDLDSLLESQRLDKNKEGLGFNAVPPPPAQIYSSPKKDLKFPDDAQNRNIFVTKTKASLTAISPKSFIKFVKANNSPTKRKADKVETDKKPHVKHMMGNISYLSDYEPFDGGYVSFGLGGCKITECIVLGQNFKMSDDDNVLLRTPRQHNMYSIDLNNIVPHKDLTCLVAKASADECILWHMRLAEAVNIACYVQTRVLVNKFQNKTPYELFNGRTPAIGFLKPFDCHVMILNTLDDLGKFEAKWDEVDAGTNSTNLSGTKDAASQEAMKDVSFLRYIALPNWVHDALLESSLSKPQDDCSTDVHERSGNSDPTATSTNPPADQLETLTVETPIPTISSPVPTACVNDSSDPSNESNEVEADVSNMETTIIASPTPTLRIHKDHPKSQIIDLVDTPIQTKNKSKKVGEQSFIATIHQKTDPALLQFCLFLCFLSQVEPKKITDALQDRSWVEAMQEELLQFKIQNVGTLVDCPKRVRPVGTKCVLKNKKDERGIVINNKARLVAQGHTQEEGIDYDEVFTPVARIKAIRLFLAYASFMGFTVYQMDVKSAFLFVYVDDIIFGSSNAQLCREFEALMHEKFQMSAMGELNFFLGLQVLQKEDGIFLSQDKYVGDILKKFGNLDVRSSNTPIDKENPLGKYRTGKDVDLHLYRSMIGSLMYLTASRPDIMFTVCACARHQVTPKECHMHAVKRIFRYLKGHPKLGLWYPKESPFDFVAYSDSDYGGATQDRKSTTKGCQFLGRRDCFEKKLISVDHIHTDKNVTDLLTKPFDTGRFQYLVCKLFPLLEKLSTVSVSLGFGLVFAGTFKYWGVLRIHMISLRLIPLFCDYHNMVAILEKSEHNVDFHPIMDFVEASPLRYALTFKPTVYVSHIRQFWSTARIKTMEEGTKILATVDGILIIVTESSLRRNLKLKDEEGISSLLDAEIFENLTLMRYDISPNQKVHFSKGSNIATALVCLATNRTYNFSKMIFDGLAKNVNNKGEGSGTPTEPHHTPSLEAQQTSYTTHLTPTLPPATTASIPTVISSKTTPLRKYTRRARISQSLALPPVADEPTSPLRDVSKGEACPTDSGFGADQDRKNIAKTSTLPHDSAPKVTSPAADEGSMQQTLTELTALCTNLQRQHSEMAFKFKAQEQEINMLKARVKLLEDKEGQGADRSGDDAPIKGRNLDEGEAAAERVSVDTEEMATVLTSMDAATILASGVAEVPTGSGSIPTAGSPTAEVPTGSDVVPTASLIFTTATVSRSRSKILPYGLKGSSIKFKRKGIRFEQESAKKLKTSEELPEEVKTPDEVSEEKVKDMMQLVPIKNVYAEALQVKHPIIDWKVHTKGQRNYWKIIRLGGSSASYQFFMDLLKHLDREDLNQLWALVNESLNNRSASIEWKLYDTCGVHQVTSKDREIFMLMEKDYPLKKGLAIVMICYKLQVENYSQMENDLILKIYKIGNCPSQKGD
uniref:Reverse transcriptase Ty1/copia-type domain-containing protein n=1 Tax=Tanacetum cinerariifolium TaxID=118510 RepID=A0A6L2NA57_TANCI|nr:hypothetical protein [Tanacetum cinerariifolium]